MTTTPARCSCAPARSPHGCSTTCSGSRTSNRSADESTYAEKITPADRQLDLGDPLDSWRRIRALSPHIGARAELQGRDVTIWSARLEDGALVPEIVQPSGRTRMSYDEFLRGLR